MTTLKCPAFNINTCWEWLVCQFSTVVSVVACLTLMPVLILCWCIVFFYLFISGQPVISKVMINAFAILLLQIRIALKRSFGQNANLKRSKTRLKDMSSDACATMHILQHGATVTVFLCVTLQGVPGGGSWTLWLPNMENVAAESLWHEARRM